MVSAERNYSRIAVRIQCEMVMGERVVLLRLLFLFNFLVFVSFLLFYLHCFPFL